MSIISGIKPFKKRIKTPDGYQNVSQWIHANTVEFDDGNSLADKYGTTSISSIGDGTLTGAISTLDSTKQDAITGAASTVVSNDLTASRVLISNVNGKLGVSGTTTDELAYVHGVTSAIQTQLNNKTNTSIWNKPYARIRPDWVDIWFVNIGTIKIAYIYDAFKGNAPSGWSALTAAGGISPQFRPIMDQFLTKRLPDGKRMTLRINTDGSISMYLSRSETTGAATRVNFVYV